MIEKKTRRWSDQDSMDMHNRQINNLRIEIVQLRADLIAVNQKLEKAEALAKFARHKRDCGVFDINGDCTCGFVKAMLA